MNNIIPWIISILMLVVIIYLIRSKEISRLFLSILIFIGIMIGVGLLCLILAFLDDPKKTIETTQIIKTSIPLIASMVAAASVVIATYNTVNGEKSSRNKTILEYIDITRDILEKGDMIKISTDIFKQINITLKSDEFKVDVLVNNGSREFFYFLNKEDGKEKNI
ncbi:hypothetical protein COE50_06240 [Bacillus anthracis]|nr:hypothetical protein COE50_06240 [Bacillus anthracis]